MSSSRELGGAILGSASIVGSIITLRLKFCSLSTTCSWILSLSSFSLGRSPDLLVNALGLVLALLSRYTILKLNLDRNSDQRA